MELVAEWKLHERCKYNSMQSRIQFSNGSEIYLLDLHHNPTDPNFDRLGSMEFTGGFLEEVAEISRKAYEIIFSRIRFKLKEFNLIPKMLIVSNPTKNWVYTDIYSPWKTGMLKKHIYFLPALATDNPHISPHYLEALRHLSEVDKQRLLLGNFEYDDDDRALIPHNKIMDIFTNDYVDKGSKYISTDLAMQGRDKFIVTYWEGMRGRVVLYKKKSTGKEIEEDIKKIANQYGVPRSNIIADSDGIGNYLKSYMTNIEAFYGGSSAMDKNEYRNLKTECAFKLAELVNQGKIYFESDEHKQDIIDELSQLKRANLDKDEAKKSLIPKEEMKENLGRSPDLLDCLIMRMYFEVKDTFYISF